MQTLNLIKKLIVVTTALSLTACYPAYQAPPGPQATLVLFPPSNYLIQRAFVIYHDPYTCVVKNRLTGKQYTHSAPITIPANQLFTFSESYTDPYTGKCNFTVSFIPKINQTYIASLYLRQHNICEFIIFNKNKPIDFVQRKMKYGLISDFTRCSDADLVKNTPYKHLPKNDVLYAQVPTIIYVAY